MLEQFTFKNYKCFKEENTLDFQALDKNSWNLKGVGGENFLPATVIYGRNGSGKSNVFEALYDMCKKVENSDTAIIPFRNSDKDTEFTFFFEDGENIEFKYMLCVNKKKITYESLSYREEGEIEAVFERKGNSFEIYEELGCAGVKITDENETLLKTLNGCSTSRYIVLPYGFLCEIIHRPSGCPSVVKPKMLDILKCLIGGIADIENGIVTYENRRHMPIEDLSKGEQKLIKYSYEMAKSFEYGLYWIIDRIDEGIHPLAVKAIVQMFGDPAFNKNFSQLLCSVYDASFMDDIRKDEIWFTKKDENGKSELYALADFIGYEDISSIRNSYLSGRFGTI